MSHDFEGLGFKFLDRLKQRHVFRVTAAYLGLAWLIVHVATVLGETFTPIHHIVPWLIYALAGGLPLVLVGAWFSNHSHGTPSARSIDPGKLNAAIIAILVLAVLALLADRLVLHRPANESMLVLLALIIVVLLLDRLITPRAAAPAVNIAGPRGGDPALHRHEPGEEPGLFLRRHGGRDHQRAVCHARTAGGLAPRLVSTARPRGGHSRSRPAAERPDLSSRERAQSRGTSANRGAAHQRRGRLSSVVADLRSKARRRIRSAGGDCAPGRGGAARKPAGVCRFTPGAPRHEKRCCVRALPARASTAQQGEGGRAARSRRTVSSSNPPGPVVRRCACGTCGRAHAVVAPAAECPGLARGEHVLAAEHYELAFELRPDDYRPITLALQEYQATKDQTREQSALRRSWQALERHLAIDPDDAYASDHAAGVLMLLGRRDEANRLLDRALDFLDRAVATGRAHREWILNDNDLAPLRDHPRFKQVLARLE